MTSSFPSYSLTTLGSKKPGQVTIVRRGRLYPFSFSLCVRYELSAQSLTIKFVVANNGCGSMPYQLGFHPAFPWLFQADCTDRYELAFSSDQSRSMFRLDQKGLIRRTPAAALLGGRLRIASDLFEEGALIFPNADSQSVGLVSPAGTCLEISVDRFPHLAVWTKLVAPFLSIEQWTGLPDWEDFSGKFSDRASISFANSDDPQCHSIRMRVR
jgi:galactose mutarotase-like enzyme